MMSQSVWSPYFYISKISRAFFLPMADKSEAIQQVPKHTVDVSKANYTQEFFGYGFTLIEHFNTVLNLDPDEI